MTLFQGFGAFAGSGAGEAEVWMLMTPTSVTTSGGTANIVGNGQVTFSTVDSLSLNGVFTGDYYSYLILFDNTMSGTASQPLLRMRNAGTDATTNYTHQLLFANDTSVGAARQTIGAAILNDASSAGGSQLMAIALYKPHATSATAGRSVTHTNNSGSRIYDSGFTHTTAASYDSVTLYRTGSATLTGKVAVYGMVV